MSGLLWPQGALLVLLQVLKSFLFAIKNVVIIWGGSQVAAV